MLSTQSPRMAVGDINGDGLEDVFIGGSKGRVGQLFFQKNDGTFKATSQTVFELNKQSEDIESLFFDADGDKDLDLYVCRVRQ